MAVRKRVSKRSRRGQHFRWQYLRIIPAKFPGCGILFPRESCTEIYSAIGNIAASNSTHRGQTIRRTRHPSTGHPRSGPIPRLAPRRLHDDYGQLQRYRADDTTVKAMPDNKNRVNLFGDFHHRPGTRQLFPWQVLYQPPYCGQTTPQMLVRFRQDVIDLHPQVVVILRNQ